MVSPDRNGGPSDEELLGQMSNQPEALMAAPLTADERNMVIMALSSKSIFHGDAIVKATRGEDRVFRVSQLHIPKTVVRTDELTEQPS